MDKYADVLNVLQLMGENHPLLEQTCLTLLMDEHTDLATAHAKLSFLREQQTQFHTFDPSLIEPGDMDEVERLGLEQEFKKTLPKLSRNEPWHFSIPFIIEHEKKTTNNQPLLNELSEIEPHQLTKSEQTHCSGSLNPANNNQYLWKKLFLKLGLHQLNSQLDDEKLSKQFAQRQAIVELPYKRPRRTDKETWFIVDQSSSNYPLYSDFRQFMDQLYRQLGQGTLRKVIEVVDFSDPIYWRTRNIGGETTVYQTGLLPLPANKQQIILLYDPANLHGAKWLSWLKQLSELSSSLVKITTLPQKGTLYFGRLKELVLAKDHLAFCERDIDPDQLAKEYLLAILSITPARFTLAMIRELRQTVTGGSLAIESQLFNHAEFIWLRASGNGYWASPSQSYREDFKALPPGIQQAAIRIICNHLPEGAPSLTHEVFLLLPLLLEETLCTRYETKINTAKTATRKMARKLMENESEPVKNQTYLNYIYDMAVRLGDYAERLDNQVKQAFTMMNFQAKQLNPTLPETLGIDPQFYLELQQQDKNRLPGKLFQQGHCIISTTSPETYGRPLAELNDISNILFNEDSSSTHRCLTPETSYTPTDKTLRVTGQSSLDKFVMELLSSDKLYWASEIEVTEEVITAMAEGFHIHWPVKALLTISDELDAVECLKQVGKVHIHDDTPSWLKEYPPQIDQYGVYTTIQVNDCQLTLRYIPAGCFIMGSPETEQGRKQDEKQHPVTLTKGFWMSDTTVSKSLWRAFMIGERETLDDFSDTSHPISNTSRAQTLTFYQKLFQKLGLVALPPSEVQWEYACRAGTTTPFNNGLNELSLVDSNYYSVNNVSDKKPRIFAVKKFKPNEWGLYQMHGNIWELCLDIYEPNINDRQNDPLSYSLRSGDSVVSHKQVLRGGNFVSNLNGCRSAARKQSAFASAASFEQRNAYYGLRICVASTSNNDELHFKDLINESDYVDKAITVFEHKMLVKVASLSQNKGKEKYREAHPLVVADLQANRENSGAKGDRFIKQDQFDLAEYTPIQRWNLRPPPQFPSPWATRYGYDKYGLWQTLKFEEIEIRFRYITSGHYILGSSTDEMMRDIDEHQHQDSFLQGFWLAETTVTQAFWHKVQQGVIQSLEESSMQVTDPAYPKTHVNLANVLSFCIALNRSVPGLNVMLPTERQWEFACRADTKTTFSNGPKLSDDYANFNHTAREYGLIDANAKAPNPWGLKQMLGNVWEWCLDGYATKLNHQQLFEDDAELMTKLHVLRGGSWLDLPENCRTAFRYYAPKQTKANNIGFRLCINSEATPGFTAFIGRMTDTIAIETKKTLKGMVNSLEQNLNSLDNKPSFEKRIVGYTNYSTVKKAAENGQRDILLRIDGEHEHVFSTNELLSGLVEGYDEKSDVENENKAGQANKLTKRQLQIAEYLINGEPDRQIAKGLNISDYTVRNHLKNIHKKLQVSSRSAAIELLSRQFKDSADYNLLYSLTKSELRVANYLMKGTTAQEIANRLNLAVRTIDNMLASIYQKLEVSKRTEAISLLYHLAKLPSNGALQPPELRDNSLLIDKLSNRQKEICLLVTKGLSNKEIGILLSIRVASVNHHMQNIFKILEVNNRAAMTALLLSNELYFQKVKI